LLGEGRGKNSGRGDEDGGTKKAPVNGRDVVGVEGESERKDLKRGKKP